MSNISSAFPEPPLYYKRYTNENLSLLKQLKEQQQQQQQGNEENLITETEVNNHNHQKFNLLDLEPPKPITEGEYYMFGMRWTVEDKLPSLEDQNVKQLYPKGDIDRVAELKKLSVSTIFSFVELLDIMVKEPEKSLEKFEEIKLLIINMKHLLNEYRPHQARDTLRLIMEDQLKKRREATKEIERQCIKLSQNLDKIKKSWKALDEDTRMDVDAKELKPRISSNDEYGKRLLPYNVKPESTKKLLEMINKIG